MENENNDAAGNSNGIYTIVGGGAIGGTLAAHLASNEAQVQIVDTDLQHVRAINSNGLRIDSPSGSLKVEVPAYSLADAPNELGFVLLAVKSQATDEATQWVSRRLNANGCIASMQNGLNEAKIARVVGPGRTIAAFVDLFADVVSPGVIADGGTGTIAIGEYCGGISRRCEILASDLLTWGSPVLSENIDGYLWSKLAFGSMLTATAFVDEDMSVVIDKYEAEMLDLVREVFSVSDSMGIQLEPFDAFFPNNLRVSTSREIVEDSLAKLRTWLQGQTKTRSGIWRDLNVRNRPTEVESQFVPVIEIARLKKIEVPLLENLVAIIKRLERKEVVPGSHLFKELRVEK